MTPEASRTFVFDRVSARTSKCAAYLTQKCSHKRAAGERLRELVIANNKLRVKCPKNVIRKRQLVGILLEDNSNTVKFYGFI
jgi:hypothetical protein